MIVNDEDLNQALIDRNRTFFFTLSAPVVLITEQGKPDSPGTKFDTEHVFTLHSFLPGCDGDDFAATFDTSAHREKHRVALGIKTATKLFGKSFEKLVGELQHAASWVPDDFSDYGEDAGSFS